MDPASDVRKRGSKDLSIQIPKRKEFEYSTIPSPALPTKLAEFLLKCQGQEVGKR